MRDDGGGFGWFRNISSYRARRGGGKKTSRGGVDGG